LKKLLMTAERTDKKPDKRGSEKYFRLLITLLAIVLLNMAASHLFVRVDLTQNRIFSLSKDSKNVVSTLGEPLTVKVFFTADLPAPYNGTEQYLKDLLKEYSVYGGRYFNYRFYNVNAEAGGPDDPARDNQKYADEYGISPVQIRHIEKDEIKFKKAYMGMVLIHGDLIERLPAITDTDGLEYAITSAIRKLNNKVSVLVRLKEKIDVRLYFSSSLNAVAPYIQLKDIAKIPKTIEETVGRLNARYFGNLKFTILDPSTDPDLMTELKQHNLPYLKWPAMEREKIPEGQGTLGLVMRHGKKSVSVPLINMVRLPLIGTQYSMVPMEEIEGLIEKQIDSLIDINADIGYLASHNTLTSAPRQMLTPLEQRDPDDISFFKTLMAGNYTLRDVDLKSDYFPQDYHCLIIARPLESFTDEELFKIDQFLMKGKSLALFIDRFKATASDQQQAFMNQGPSETPLSTGLEKLLAHYGVEIKPSFVMDKNCFHQPVGSRFGGGERPIWFAPIIQNQNISHDLDFMKNIKGLVLLKTSPLALDMTKLKANQIAAHTLFTSSDQSWEMGEPVNLHPLMIQPPVSEEKFQKYTLACLLEGEFPSYFADRPIPDKVTATDKTTDETPNKQGKQKPPSGHADPAGPSARITGEDAVIKIGKPGKILLIASSEVLKNSLLDEEGKSANATFLLNVLDTLNGREDTAVLRAKVQQLNPLRETGPGLKAFVKFFNMIGLPVMVVLAGMIVWALRHSRKRNIQAEFSAGRS
jgi:ABC-2 type transport system permease protein